MNSDIVLTPAQVEFLKTAINGFSVEKWNIELAGRAGSQRYFVRVSDKDRSYVLVVWDSHDEDWDRFLTMQKDLYNQVPFLPVIYKDDPSHGLILEEDLGAVTLKNFCIENVKNPGAVEAAYKKVLDALRKWQLMPVTVSQSIAARSMDYDTFMWETGYFARFCVTDYCACEKLLNDNWENERIRLATACANLPQTCIHRDFQSENVMIHNDTVRFVDYQGARIGPPEYDTASLLFDPYIKLLCPKIVENLFSYYQHISNNSDDGNSFYLCAAQRLMQALGAYGNLSLHKGKEWYKEFIPLALDRLSDVLTRISDYSYIASIVEECRIALKETRENRMYIG